MELEKRIDRSRTISPDVYYSALLNLSEDITNTLQEYLINEGRFKGLAKSYVNSMWDTFTDINIEVSKEDEDSFHRVIYLFKDSIVKEFKSLHIRKHLSLGDCLIVILKRMYEVILESVPEDYVYTRRIKTLLKLITKFFDNIKNRKKTSNLFPLSNDLKYGISTGYIGKHGIPTLTFPSLTPIKVVEVLDNPGDRLMEDLEEDNNIISTIEL